MGAGGNEQLEKHMDLHEALAEKHGSQSEREEVLEGIPTEAEVPEGQPQGELEGTPEEQALAQSLSELGGGV